MGPRYPVPLFAQFSMNTHLQEALVVILSAFAAALTGLAQMQVVNPIGMQEVSHELHAGQEALPYAVPAEGRPVVEKSVTVKINIIQDNSLRMICIIGAIGGAVGGVCLFGWRDARELGLKIVGSSVISIIFTPGFMRYFSIAPEMDLILLWAGINAIFGAAVLKGLFPAVTRSGTALLSRLLGVQAQAGEGRERGRGAGME